MKLEEKIRIAEPKQGNKPEENEDRLRTTGLGSAKQSGVRVALCDGASESAFARDWAGIVARRFVDRPLDIAGLDSRKLQEWLEPCQAAWNDRLPEKIPWHGRAKVQRGALATLLGVTFRIRRRAASAVSWQAMAVGDSCLFIVRDDRLSLTWPLISAAQFDNAPALVCSNPANNQQLQPQFLAGQCGPGDLFILASDALSAWILREWESGRKPWRSLLALNSDSDLERREWVDELRSKGSIRNDDTTLLLIEVAKKRG